MPASQAPLPGNGRARIAVLSAGLLALFALVALAVHLVGWVSSSYSTFISVIAFCAVSLALFVTWRAFRLESAMQQSWRDQAEARLQESERRYMELVEQAVTGFVVRRPDGQLILVNEAYCRMTGYTREELLKLKARDMVVDQAVLEKVANLKPGESTQIDTLMKCKGGELKEVQYVTQRRPDGNLQSVLLDLSDRKRVERAREESERRYAELVDQALEGIMVRRPDGKLLFVNDALCRMLAYTRPELLALTIRDIVHPEDAETIDQVQRLQAGEHLNLQKRMVRKDGRVIYVEVSARRLKEGDIQTTVHDVTQARLAEQSRIDTEQRYHDLVEQAADAIWLRDAGGRMLLVNEAACRLLGYTAAELMATRSEQLIHPSDPGTAARIDALRRGDVLRLERIMRHKDGHAVPVEAVLHRLADGNLQVITRDISERKAAEERFRSMVEGAPNAMIMADETGRIVLANAQAERMFGYTRQELIGQAVEMLVPHAHRRSHVTLREDYQREPQLRSMGAGRDLHGVRKDGSEVPVEIGLNPINTSEGRRVLASIIDITARREAEARERQYMEDLRTMSQQLLQAQETERRAIARELHDEVGQSLTATRLNLRDLEQQAAGGPLAPRLGDTSNIVADLLGKVRQMSLDLHPSVLDDLGLAAALRWCVRTRAGGSGLEVQFDIAPGLPRFPGMTEITLFRVFQEALSNVLKHADAKRLTVILQYEAGRLEMVMLDDGRGFTPEAARKHALSGGSLGMVGMEERTRLAGGTLVVDSAPGQGAEIRVILPAAARDDEGMSE